MTERDLVLVRAGIVVVLWSGIMIALIYAAIAHEWYPGICCGGGECRQVPCAHLEPYKVGWRYTPQSREEQMRSRGDTAWYFERDQVRESPDGQCHVCTLYLGNWAYNMRRGMCAFIPNVGY